MGNTKLNNLRQTLLSQYQANSVISHTPCQDWGEAGDADGFWGHESQVWALAFSPDGSKLISSSDDQTARLWDVATGKCLNILRGYTRDIYSVAFSSNNQILASGSDDSKIGLWDLSTSKCHSLLGHIGRISSVKALGAIEKGDRLPV